MLKGGTPDIKLDYTQKNSFTKDAMWVPVRYMTLSCVDLQVPQHLTEFHVMFIPCAGLSNNRDFRPTFSCGF